MTARCKVRYLALIMNHYQFDDDEKLILDFLSGDSARKFNEFIKDPNFRNTRDLYKSLRLYRSVFKGLVEKSGTSVTEYCDNQRF